LERERDELERRLLKRECPFDSCDRLVEAGKRAEKAEADLTAWRDAWVQVCREGNVPQYEGIEPSTATPGGLLHGIRQLACLESGERSIRKSVEADLAAVKAESVHNLERERERTCVRMTERDAAREKNANLLDLLRHVEWAYHNCGDGHCVRCPMCHQWMADGHAPDCELAEVLKGGK
jgi:hypothetical protein